MPIAPIPNVSGPPDPLRRARQGRSPVCWPAARRRHRVLAAGLGAVIAAIAAAPAMAVPFRASSAKVALIPGAGPVPSKPSPCAIAVNCNGVMPTAGPVSGRPAESFDKFSFSPVALSQITSANLANYDTVALIRVVATDLTAAQKKALADFVRNGGKLLIRDADGTTHNDYSWLPYPAQIGAGCNSCGSGTGTSAITENSGLISANSADPSYVDLKELSAYTDAIGDANLFVTLDPHWFVAASGANAIGEKGAQVAYAAANGLMIYDGFDTDLVKTTVASPWRCRDGAAPLYTCPAPASGVDWLAQMWYAELNKGWGTPAPGAPAGTPGAPAGTPGAPGAPGGASSPTGLPQTTQAVQIGTQLSPSLAGLPVSKSCVRGRKLSLGLARLAKHQRLAQVDVYVNGKHVLRKRGARNLKSVKLGGLPRRGSYTVKIIATTKRGYHIISERRYRAC